MKKALSLFLVLLLASCGFLIDLQADLLEERDQINFTDEILYGDEKDAEGLSVTIHTQYSNQLFWDTVYTAGANPSVSTDYTFYNTDLGHNIATDSGISLNPDFQSYYFDPNEEQDELFGIDKAFYELYQEPMYDATGVGYESKTKVVFLKDYYDYYPLEFHITLDNFNACFASATIPYSLAQGVDIEEDLQFLYDFFRIPVFEDDARLLELDCYNSNSFSTGVNYSETYPAYLFEYKDTMTEDALFFTFAFYHNEKEKSEITFDDSLIPGGYGLYRIPYSAETKIGTATQTPDIQSLSMVYPFDQSIIIYQLTATKDLSKLILVYEDKDTPSASMEIDIIDASTLELLQNITLEGIEQSDGSTATLIPYSIFLYDDYFVLLCSGDYLVVLEEQASGLFTTALVTDIHQNPIFDYYINGPEYNDLAWDGSKLALTGLKKLHYEDYYYQESCGFYLAIFDENGLVYFSEHASSLDRVLSPDGNGKPEPLSYYYGSHPLELKWAR